jgi:hypothetical protein
MIPYILGKANNKGIPHLIPGHSLVEVYRDSRIYFMSAVLAFEKRC